MDDMGFMNQVLGDRYRIQSLLGRQTGRRTFLAADLQKDCSVVIKLVLFGPDFTWEDLKLFEREAMVLRSLDHPAIPQCLDYFESDNELGKGFALVQTYIEAQSLQDWVQAGRIFSEADLNAIAQSLLEILAYLHDRQPPIVHRDIKPSNVLLGGRAGNHPGKIYLVDFGSVQTAPHNGTQTIVGTYGYMPPEQFGGRITPATDLYALGATLIYLATGQHPDQLPQREMRILFADQVNLSPRWIDLLEWLTEPSVNLRLNSAKQALEILESPSSQEVCLTTIPKPVDSKVCVVNTQDLLEIFIPPKVHPLIFLGIAVMAGWFWGISKWVLNWLSIILSNWSISNLFAGAILLSFLCYGLWMLWLQRGLIPNTLFALFGCVRLRINQSEISLSREMFGLVRLPVLISPRRYIHKLEVTPLIKKGPDESDIPPDIKIWVGAQVFKLGNQDERLSVQELEWIAQNLSHWLNLPITRSSEN